MRNLKNIRATTYFALASVLLFAAMGVYTYSLSPSIPELQLTFTEEAFYKILNQWDAREFSIFKGHFFIDFVFLFHYGVLGYLLTTRTLLFQHINPSIKSAFAWMLPAAAVLDAVENFFHLYLVSAVGSIAPVHYTVPGIVAALKWFLILSFILFAGYRAYRSARSEID